MSVRAKFKVDRVSQTLSGTEIELTPVMGDSEDNKKFFKYTPYGSLKMGVVNPDAAEQFTPGAEFYIDFTPAE